MLPIIQILIPDTDDEVVAVLRVDPMLIGMTELAVLLRLLALDLEQHNLDRLITV